MNITAHMLRDLERAVAHDAIAALVITPDHYYVEVTYCEGRIRHREIWPKTEYGIDEAEKLRMATDWARLISVFVDPERYSANRPKDDGRFGESHGWSHFVAGEKRGP